jgi:UDP-N-acetyl-D-glucosamine/UDP-N-acetyl-D-galactosamine dehydrogenase
MRLVKLVEKICVVGLGYVGLPLALVLGPKFPCVGFDINAMRVQQLAKNIDVNQEHSAAEIIASGVTFTDDLTDARNCTTYIVTVPTPVNSDHVPDLSPLQSACQMIGPMLNKGDLVVFESTVYPGCTEDFCGPLLAKFSGLRPSEDFHLGYSPERINPGDKMNTIETITKVVSGDDAATLTRVAGIYQAVIDAGIHMAGSIRVAEASKLTENIQRDVNIALMNELSSVYTAMGIRTRQVLEAAGTKWNFIPFRPGMVGGHCIGVDPYYLIDAADKQGIDTPLLDAARSVNEGVVPRILEHFRDHVPNEHGKTLILGLTFKEDCSDLRNSKALELANGLAEYTRVQVLEPNIDSLPFVNLDLVNSFSEAPYDCVIIAVRHRQFENLSRHDLQALVGPQGHVFDLHDSFKLDLGKGFWL